MEFDFSRYSKIVANDLSLNGSISSALGGLSQWSSSSSDIYFNDGNVGIGTSSPTSKLDIFENTGDTENSIRYSASAIANTTSKSYMRLERGNYGGAIGGYLEQGVGAGIVLGTVSNGTITDRMTIKSNGNVGIGTTNPTTKLHVYASDNSSVIRINNGTSTAGFYLEQSTNKFTYIRNTESTGGIIFHAGNAERMRLTNDGRLGIGTAGPGGLISLRNTSGDNVFFRTSGYLYGWRWYSRYNRSWDFAHDANGDIFRVYFANSTSRGGYFDPNSNVTQFTFTGQHRNFVEDIPSTESEDYKGLIVSANKNAYYDIDYSIKTGCDAITINDALPYVSLCKKEKDKSVYGVISDGEDEETRKYSAGTFVSVKEKQYGDNRMFINSVGEGAIWVSNKNGNLESGDYITSSSIPGYGQKQDSEFLANYSVAKITMDCNFQPDYIYKKKVTTRNVDITGPDASGNYYDVLNNERLYTIDLSDEISDNKNKKYTLSFDDADNLIGATQNVLDEKRQVQWEDTTEQEYAYNIRYVDPSGNIITKEQHDTTISNGGSVYIAAFVGCTYHCG